MTNTTDTSSADFDRQVEAVLTQGKALLARHDTTEDADDNDAVLIKALNRSYDRTDRWWRKRTTDFEVKSYSVD